MNTTTTTETTPITTTTTLAHKNLGLVSKCTLVGAISINIHSGNYCIVNKGKKTRPEAYSQCKAANARLPLPKNNVEMAAFLKFSPNKTWIDITNPVKGQKLILF